jgi:EthD domain
MVKEDQVKVFAMLPQRPDVSKEYFHEHWLHPHGTWSLDMEPLRRYVQSHRTQTGVDGAIGSSYEGIAIVWFDGLEAALAMGEDPVYKAKVQPDEPLFIDMSGLAFVMADEYVLRPGPLLAKDDPPGSKVMLLLRRVGGSTPEEFAAGLSSRADSVADLSPEATRITLAVADPTNYAEGAQPACDAIVEVWYPDDSRLASAWPADGKSLIDALGPIVDQSGILGDVYEEMRLIWPAGEARA